MSKKKKKDENEDLSESYKVFSTFSLSSSDESDEDDKNVKIKKNTKPNKSATNLKTDHLSSQASDLSVFSKFDKKHNKKHAKKFNRKIEPTGKDEEKVQKIIEHMVDENRLKPDLQDQKDDKHIQTIMNDLIEETKLKPEFVTKKESKDIKPIIEYSVNENRLTPELETDNEVKEIGKLIEHVIDSNKLKPEKTIRDDQKRKDKLNNKKSDKKLNKKLDKKLNSKEMKPKQAVKKNSPELAKEKVKTIIKNTIDDDKLKKEIEAKKTDEHIKKIIKQLIDKNKQRPEIESKKNEKQEKKIIQKIIEKNNGKPKIEKEPEVKDIRKIIEHMVDENKLKPEIEPKKKVKDIRKIIEHMVDENKLKPEIKARKNEKHIKKVIEDMIDKNNQKLKIESEKRLENIKKESEKIVDKDKKRPKIKTEKEVKDIKKIIEHMVDENKLKPEIETEKKDRDIKKIIEHMIDENKLKPEIIKSDEKIKKQNLDKPGKKEKPDSSIPIDSENKGDKKTDLLKKEDDEFHLKELKIPSLPDIKIAADNLGRDLQTKKMNEKSADEKLRNQTKKDKLTDDFPYSKERSSLSNFDLSNKTDEIKFSTQKLNSILKEQVDPLERIRHKLEQQIYLKQEKPSDFELNSEKRRSSVQQPYKHKTSDDKLDQQLARKKEKKKKSESLTYLEEEPTVDDHKQKESSPEVKIEDDMKEIHIKNGQNMKANLTLGKGIKAQIEDRDNHRKIDSDKSTDNDDDWSSISIQLDITKDPKTKKIEINEDVKVLQKENAKMIPKETDEDDKNKQILEDSKKEQVNTFYEPNELIPYVLGQKPSITHYVNKVNEPGVIKKDDEIKTQQFDRYYTPSETDVEKIYEKKHKQTDDLKSKSQQTILTINEDEQDKSNSDHLGEQGVVLFKAKTDTEKKIGSSKESNKNLKRMDIFDPSDKRRIKKPFDDSSSDEQTYEQIINKRNEILKSKFPSSSPPAFQPTPPPFHLKMKKPSTDSIRFSDAKSEELTYYEQKKKFNLSQNESSDEKTRRPPNFSDEPEKVIKKLDDKLVEKQSVDYENIKRLDIPSEKVAEIGNEDDLILNDLKPKEQVKKASKLKHEVRIDKKDNEIKKPRANFKLSSESEQLILEREDDETIINKFKNEIERLRKLEQYLIKIKSILNDEDSDLNIKKSLIKRLILIKKDLDKLSEFCDKLLDRKYLNRKSSSRRKENIKDDDKEDYLTDSDEDKNVKKSNFRMIKDELTKKLLEQNNKRQLTETKDQSTDTRDEFDSHEEKAKTENSKDFKKDKDKRLKNRNFIEDKKEKFKKIKNNLIKLSKMLLSSNIFGFFLCFFIFCTFMFTYCYFNQSRMHKRFPCRLKRKM